MPVGSSTHYDLTRIREMGPEAKDWATVDHNFETLSLLIKALEQHNHSATASINYPGYNVADPNQPVLPTLDDEPTGGILSPGTTIGVRLAYVNSLGLETAGSPEAVLSLPVAAARPLTPTKVSVQAASPGLPGGTYIYVITKVKGSGESLPSDVLPVEVLYDQTYSVTIGFEAISSYPSEESVSSLKIYRSAGLNSAFQLLATITTTGQTTYTDNNTISSANTQPPSSSTFDASKKIRIDWAAITHPSAAAKLRVYVTQQAGMWATQHLLTEADLSGTPATYYDYLGSESLLVGWPRNASQIPASPPKLNLSTEATGAPTLTANMNFAGFQAQNMRLHNNSGAPASPTNGFVYYDTSTNNVRAYINGSWVNWGTTTATAYSHPAEEAGGHLATNIRYVTGSGTNNVGTILGRFVDSSGNSKQVQTVSTSFGSGSLSTTSTTWVDIAGASITIAPVFTNQYVEVYFTAHASLDMFGANVSFGIDYDSSLQERSIQTWTSPAVNGSFGVHIVWTGQLGTAGVTKTIKAKWVVSSSTARLEGDRRAIVGKLIF